MLRAKTLQSTIRTHKAAFRKPRLQPRYRLLADPPPVNLNPSPRLKGNGSERQKSPLMEDSLVPPMVNFGYAGARQFNPHS
jgi:hypothetical protein